VDGLPSSTKCAVALTMQGKIDRLTRI
jgi:hypothetical protein